MSDYCPDCGLPRNNGICSNCQEELYILTYQAEFIESPYPSEEFTKKAAEQSAYLAKEVTSEDK